MRLSHRIAACAILLGAAGLLFFLYVDQRIVAHFKVRRASVSAVFSEQFRVAPGGSVSRMVIQNELARRGYRLVEDPPRRPGEYSLREQALRVVTREFEDFDGIRRESQQLELASISDGFRNLAEVALQLEPEVLAPLGFGELRAARYQSLSEIPPALQQAVVAIEDERFFRHPGIDFAGIARAMAVNLRAMRIVQGGSTITQQLAKNLLFSSRRTLGRKLSEAAAAISLERRFTKEEILELYLNEVYFGQEGPVAIHGVAEAARTFLGKRLKELSLAECALLAGIIKGPSAYNPRKHVRKALKRKDVVIDKMRELNMISATEASSAKLARIRVVDSPAHVRSTPWYLAALNKRLDTFFDVEGASRAGISVYTGINRVVQECAERAVANAAVKLERDFPRFAKSTRPLEISLIAIEPHSGKIKAWVGGRDFSRSQFDHVMQAKRQVGSTMKPFLYLTALDSGLNSYRTATPLTVLSDRPMKFELPTGQSWEPENFDHQFRGEVTLRYALENSLNLPAAYIGQRIGIAALARTARRFHIAEELPEVPALALGAAESSLLQLTAGYGALANGGVYVAPRLFISARDHDGSSLADEPLVEERVADENAVFVLTNILQGAVERGTGKVIRALGVKSAVAGKTGTSNDTRDAWFVGFTPSLVAGVWVGFDDNAKTGLSGGVAAAPVWGEFMRCVEPSLDPLDFIAPPGVVYVPVDANTGELATSTCPNHAVIREVFVRGTEPEEACSQHRDGRILSSGSAETRRPPSTAQRRRSLWELLFSGR